MADSKSFIDGWKISKTIIDEPRTWKNHYLGEFVERDTEYDVAYEAWTEYYLQMERIDRAWPHMPARKRSKEVIPLPQVDRKPNYKLCLDTVNERCRGLNPESVRKARNDAGNDCDRALAPCDCKTCTDPYWSRA